MDLLTSIKEMLSQRTRPLQFLDHDELPEDIPAWLLEHGTELEIGVLTGIVFCLLKRGADPVDCARYAVDSRVELPFQGCEEQLARTVFASILANGFTPHRIAQLIEFLCFAGETIQVIAGPSKTTNALFSSRRAKEPARA